MTVYILMREDQNDHGFVDTGIVGVFFKKEDAEQQLVEEEDMAREEGAIVESDDYDDWEVSFSITEEQVV